MTDDAKNPIADGATVLHTDQGQPVEIPGFDPNAPPIDFEERGREYLHAAKKRDAIARYEADCEKGYPEADWTCLHLAPYADAIDKVRNWQYGPRGILASGPTGRGKSRAVFDLYRRLACEEGRDVKYCFAGDWFSALQGEIRYGRDDARAWVENMACRSIVILDDLGQEAVTTARQDWAEAWFFRFLDLRVAKKLPLIVTTNLDARAIAGATDSRGYPSIRANPLIRRLLELTVAVKFETQAEQQSNKEKKK